MWHLFRQVPILMIELTVPSLNNHSWFLHLHWWIIQLFHYFPCELIDYDYLPTIQWTTQHLAKPKGLTLEVWASRKQSILDNVFLCYQRCLFTTRAIPVVPTVLLSSFDFVISYLRPIYSDLRWYHGHDETDYIIYKNNRHSSTTYRGRRLLPCYVKKLI